MKKYRFCKSFHSLAIILILAQFSFEVYRFGADSAISVKKTAQQILDLTGREPLITGLHISGL
jgi:uncharacterized membrane protein YukC